MIKKETMHILPKAILNFRWYFGGARDLSTWKELVPNLKSLFWFKQRSFVLDSAQVWMFGFG